MDPPPNHQEAIPSTKPSFDMNDSSPPSSTNPPTNKSKKSTTAIKKPYVPRPLSKDHTPMFRVREEQDRIIHTLTNPSQTKEQKDQRKDVCQRVPRILCSQRNLTPAELAEVGWVEAGRKPHFMEIDIGHDDEVEVVSYPFLQFVNEEQLFRREELWDKFVEMQKIAVNPAFRQELKRVTKKKETTYELSFSVVPGNDRANALMLSRTGKVENEEFGTMRRLVAECGSMLVEEHLPDLATMLRRRWCVDASLTVGSEDNFAISGLQMNFTTLDSIVEGNGKSETLGDFSGLHMDGMDDPGRVTVILNLSHLPENYFPGRFNITTARITVPVAPFTAIIFRGTHPHFATGFGKYLDDCPLNSALRYRPAGGVELPVLPEGTPYCRIVPVGYPKECLARPTTRIVHSSLFSEQAISTFGSRRAHLEWQMRMFIKCHFKVPPKGTTTPIGFCKMFSKIDKDGEDIPREWIAEMALEWCGVEDTEWLKTLKAADLISVNKRFISPKTGGQVKWASEVWTNLDGTAEAKPVVEAVDDMLIDTQDTGSMKEKPVSKRKLSEAPSEPKSRKKAKKDDGQGA